MVVEQRESRVGLVLIRYCGISAGRVAYNMYRAHFSWPLSWPPLGERVLAKAQKPQVGHGGGTGT